MTAAERPAGWRCAYLVTTHRDPPQIERLVRTIRRESPDAAIVVHHNYAQCSLDPGLFADLPGVHVVRNVRPLEWGDWSLQQRQLDAFRWTLDHVEFDWLVLVSGQDYPVQPLAEAEDFLASTPHDAVFSHDPVRRDADGEVWRRYHFRYFRLPFALSGEAAPGGGPARGPSRREKALRWFERAQSLVTLRRMPAGLPARLGLRWRTPFGPDLVCHKGAAWLNLRRSALERALSFLDANPRLVAHYRQTVIPEESLLQTVLANDPETRVLNRNLRFVVWDPGSRGSPDVLRVEHLEAMLASGKSFARKFDPAVDASVLDRLDEVLAAARPVPPGDAPRPEPRGVRGPTAVTVPFHHHEWSVPPAG